MSVRTIFIYCDLQIKFNMDTSNELHIDLVPEDDEGGRSAALNKKRKRTIPKYGLLIFHSIIIIIICNMHI